MLEAISFLALVGIIKLVFVILLAISWLVSFLGSEELLSPQLITVLTPEVAMLTAPIRLNSFFVSYLS